MGKNKHKKKKAASYQGPTLEQLKEKSLQELDVLVIELKRSDEDPNVNPGPLWGEAHKLLLKTKADSAESIGVITSRDIAALEHFIAILRADPEAIQRAEAQAQADADKAAAVKPPTDFDPEVLRNAMRAFRKRLKLTQLDHESRLGVGPMSSGKKAGFDAIMAPTEFPAEIWETLTAMGRLTDTGQGFYKLNDNK